MVARLGTALLVDALLAFVVPMPLLVWTAFFWPGWAPRLCDPPADDAGTGCEGLYLLVFLLVLPLASIVIGVLYTGVSLRRGRTPAMVLLAPSVRLRRSGGMSTAGWASALGTAVVLALGGVWALHAFMSGRLIGF